LYSPAMPAALSKSGDAEAAGKAGEHKAVARPPHSERVGRNRGASEAKPYCTTTSVSLETVSLERGSRVSRTRR